MAKKTNFNISLLQIGAKLYHQLGNFLSPIWASVITKLGQIRFITNWDMCFYKLEQFHFIINWGKCYYKLGQLNFYKSGQVLLQIKAAITN